MSAAAFACRRRPSKRRRDAPDHALPSSKQPLMTRHAAAAASSSSGGATAGASASASASSYALPRRVHFFVHATDSKTIAMHAGWDDIVGVVLGHLAACGYGRDLRLLYAGRQLAPEATLRSTPYPQAWQLASHIAATTSAAESEAASGSGDGRAPP